MGGGRGISHVDMPRESQDGGQRGQRYITCCQGISHVDMMGEGQRYITC